MSGGAAAAKRYKRYAWLNTVQAVGKGELDGSNLTYEWYEVR